MRKPFTKLPVNLDINLSKLWPLKWLDEEDKLHHPSTRSSLCFSVPDFLFFIFGKLLQLWVFLFHYFQEATTAPQQAQQSYYIIFSRPNIFMSTGIIVIRLHQNATFFWFCFNNTRFQWSFFFLKVPKLEWVNDSLKRKVRMSDSLSEQEWQEESEWSEVHDRYLGLYKLLVRRRKLATHI